MLTAVLDYIRELVTLDLSGLQFWEVTMLTVVALLHANVSRSRRKAQDEGWDYQAPKFLVFIGPITYVLYAVTFMSFDLFGEHSLLLAVALGIPAQIVADTHGRNSAARQGILGKTGLSAHSYVGLAAKLLWTLAAVALILVGLAPAAAMLLPPAFSAMASKKAVSQTLAGVRDFEIDRQRLAVILAVSENALNPGDWTGTIDGGNVEVVRVPAAAALKATGLAERLEQVAPHLMVEEASAQRIVFGPISAAAAEQRRLVAETGGLVTGVESTGSTNAEAFTWTDQTPKADVDAGSDW